MKKNDELLVVHGEGMADTEGYHERFYRQEQAIRDRDSKETQKNGVVYTPVAVVDFINESVNAILQMEFGVTMDNPFVEILDPFAGTGIFLSRAIENGLINPECQKVQQIELMPDTAEIARTNVEIAIEKAGKHGHVETINADTFTMNPDTLEAIENED